MYARVFTITTQSEKKDEITQIIRDSVLPAAKQQQGFKGYLALLDPNTGKAMAIGLWETEADVRASEASGYVGEQLAKGAHLFTSTPVQEVYEVSIQEMQHDRKAGQAHLLMTEAQAGKTDEVIRIVRDTVLPVVKQLHGFSGMLLLNERTTGKAIAITMWETEADLKAGASGYPRGHLRDVLATAVVSEAYAVSIQV